MSPYQTCCLYRALKLHFTSSYDFIKYEGKIKYSIDQFNKNPQRFVYEKFSRKYSDKELFGFFIANFLENESIWIQDLSQKESEDNYKKYLKIRQSLTYVFENDIINTFDEDHQDLFKVKSGEFPVLLTKFLRNEISKESLIIMDDFIHFIPVWDKKIHDDILWPKISNKLKKYKPFLKYDKNKFKIKLLETVNILS